jgi:hypothetical protein
MFLQFGDVLQIGWVGGLAKCLPLKCIVGVWFVLDDKRLSAFRYLLMYFLGRTTSG